jgi:catechol 2,3-dioxygenase-like lactoylglutathione lyase family enzyme
MLSDGTVTANMPASDLKRARDFYAEKLGMTPTNEFEGVFLLYETDGGTQFSVYETESPARPVTPSLNGTSTTSTRWSVDSRPRA